MNRIFILCAFFGFAAGAAVTAKAPKPSPQILLEFRLENNGTISNSKIITVDAGQASIESTDSKNQPFKIEVSPKITSIRVKNKEEKVIKVSVSAKAESATTKKETSIKSD